MMEHSSFPFSLIASQVQVLYIDHMRANLYTLFCASLLLALPACIPPRIESRGYVDALNRTKDIATGVTTRDEVREMLGTPSVTNNFGDETWYYIHKQKEAVAFLEPEITQQRVTRIIFDNAGVVKSIDAKGLKDSQTIAIAKEITPSEGQELGFFEQILGNVGRFNASESTRNSQPIRR
jgi:outer membrane protein assembly factor BamE (lipoprotein component of BamABCDE complex)